MKPWSLFLSEFEANPTCSSSNILVTHLLGREVYISLRSHYSRLGLMHFNPGASDEMENVASWKHLIDLQSVAGGGWY